LGVAILALLASLFLIGKQGRFGKFNFKWTKLLVGGVGLSFIGVAVIAAITIAIRAKSLFDAPLQGYFYMHLDEPFNTGGETNFQPAYWMAYGVGLFCILLAILSDRIIGRAKIKS
jgi:hypothetical protein